MVKATVQPGGKGGADYLDDPDAWQEEQNQIARQLIPQQGQLAGIGMQAGGPVLPLNKTPEEAKPPSMAPGLGTVGGAPSSKPTGEEPPPEQKAATPPPSFNPREAGAKPVENKPSFDPRDAGAKPIEQQAAPKTTFDPRAAGAKPVEQPAKPEEEKPAQPPQVQQPPQTPPAQDHPIAQDQPSTEDQIAAMVKQGVSPGAAQAIVKGQPPTTISGEKPAGPKLKQQQEQPQQQKQPWAPTGALTADSKNRVDPVALYRYLLGKFSKSSVLNHPPADGADWGIKTGSAAEWAAFGLAIAKQESDLDARSTNLEDPGGSYGLFQFSQTGQPKYTNGEDQYDPQKSADAFVRSVEQLVGGKGNIAHMGVTFGSILRPHEAGQYLEGAQKVAAGGSGADLVSSGGGGDGKGTRAPEGPGGPGGPGELAFIPVIPSHGPTASEHVTAQSALPGPSGGGGGTARPTGTSQALNFGYPGSLGNLFPPRGAAVPVRTGGAEGEWEPEEPQAQNPMVQALVNRGFSLEEATKFAQASQTITPGKGVPALTTPPAAPSGQQAQPVSLQFTPVKQLPGKVPPIVPAKAPAAPGARAPLALPPPAPAATAAKAPTPTPAAKPQAPTPAPQAPAKVPAKPAAPPSRAPTPFAAPSGSTRGQAHPPSFDALAGLPLEQAKELHKTLVSPDDPRVKKVAGGKFKGEHFVEGDPVHEQALGGLPYGKQGRQGQILGHGQTAIANTEPMHISYISSPKEAAKFPTRETRTIQYEKHSPEARLMGTTEGQLVGHSMLPVAVGIKPPEKKGDPHQGYIDGISTNVLANNFQHLNTKLAGMGRKTPYAKMGTKFFNDVRGYYANLNAGHTGTGRGYAVGTEAHPNEPDRTHVPYKLTRKEADFINLVINNTAAFAKHADAKEIRELARANGTLITEAGETNRMRHDIEQHEPGWRQRVIEPSIRTFNAGLIHEIHPSEEHMPATIRPGKEYQDLTRAIAHTSEQGRPDIPIAASLHHTFTDNAAINQIERAFSEHKIDEAEARSRLHALGEDPDEYRFVGGSGGLITPYEDDPEALTPEEHTQMKSNLRDQWINGKMDADKYRQKSAEVPLPTKPSKAVPAPAPKPEPSEEPAAPQPKAPKPTPVESQEEPQPSEKVESPAPTPKPPKTPPAAPGEPAASRGYVSPNVEEGTKIKGALKQAASPEHKKARDFYQRVEDASKSGGKVTPTVGNWGGTAEGSSMIHSPSDNLDQMRLKNAIRGLHSAQKGTANFEHKEGGPDRLYDIDFPNAKHEEVDKLITEHKFPGNTIYQGPEGHLRAHLLDYGAENHENAIKLAQRAGSQSPQYHHGHIAFDGGDTREAAAEEYRRIAREGGIQTREAHGEPRLRGNAPPGQHPLQSLYEEAEDNYARLAKGHGFGQPPEAPGAAAPPPAKTEEKAAPSTGPPGPGEPLPKQAAAPAAEAPPPAKGEKAPKVKTKEDLDKEVKELAMKQAAPDREDISPQEQAEMTRLNKLGKAFVKKNPEVHPQSMHAHLTGARTFPGKLKNEQIGEYYDANNPKLDYENEDHREHVSNAVVHDIMHSLAGTTTGGKPSHAYGWYNRTIKKSLKKASEIAPKILTDPTHELAFKLAWAITSQGQDVFPNTESTWAAYRHFVKTGRLPESRDVFGGGLKADQMEENFAKVNKLWHGDEKTPGLGHEKLLKMLMKRMTVGQLKKNYPGLDVGGELAHHTVNGAMMLGAKIGAFFSNLNGDFEPTTMDLWFSRNMNLMAGNMFKFSDEAARVDRMEKGELVKSHLSQLSWL